MFSESEILSFGRANKREENRNSAKQLVHVACIQTEHKRPMPSGWKTIFFPVSQSSSSCSQFLVAIKYLNEQWNARTLLSMLSSSNRCAHCVAWTISEWINYTNNFALVELKFNILCERARVCVRSFRHYSEFNWMENYAIVVRLANSTATKTRQDKPRIFALVQRKLNACAAQRSSSESFRSRSNVRVLPLKSTIPPFTWLVPVRWKFVQMKWQVNATRSIQHGKRFPFVVRNETETERERQGERTQDIQIACVFHFAAE